MKHCTHYQPKIKGKSDFYSWNLFRWLRKQNKEPEYFRKTNVFKSEYGALFIGTRYNKWNSAVTGTRLGQLCSSGSDRTFPLVGVWSGSHKWEDVTDWFWSEYERIGVCAIHDNIAHNFTYLSDNTARTCQYCGKVEKRRVEMVERVTWELVE